VPNGREKRESKGNLNKNDQKLKQQPSFAYLYYCQSNKKSMFLLDFFILIFSISIERRNSVLDKNQNEDSVTKQSHIGAIETNCSIHFFFVKKKQIDR
jgi:hypothetical protein